MGTIYTRRYGFQIRIKHKLLPKDLLAGLAPRRSAYYKPVKSPPKVKAEFREPIKALIEQEPSFGYRTVAHLLNMNKNTVQRIFQLMGWQVKKRPVGFRPRVKALPSIAGDPNERWSTICAVSGLGVMAGLCWPW